MYVRGTNVATAPNMLLRGGLTLLLALAGVVAACGAPEKAEKLCTPDANVFCRCEDRKEGTKKCGADGASFAACLPCNGSGDTGPGSSGSDGIGSRSPSSSSSSDEGPSKSTTDTTDTTDEKPKPTKDAGPNSTTPTEDTTPKKPTTSGSTTGSTSGSTSKPTPDGNATFPDAPHCKPLTNGAPKIEAQKLADAASAPTGGKPKDGLYYQAWVVQFTGEDGESGPSKHYSQETLELMGDVGRFVFSDDEGSAKAGGFRLTTVEGKNKVTIAYECPAAAPKDLAYDATDTTLVLYDPPYARVFYRQTAGTK